MTHWVSVIDEAGVPVGPINKTSDVVADEQVNARNMFLEINHPRVPELRVPNSPLKLTGTPGETAPPAAPAG